MALIPGTRLGVYEITALIGVGGMGEVYKATDTNLKRAVAVKVLPAEVAADVERLARFQREAEVLAALNHPNIAAIYGLERSSEMTALVMELVEGEDLSQRIAKGAIPVDEALPVATQIAEALEAAHEQGIIHRDLKPANIKVRSDGTVKVLDFGLAKAMDAGAGAAGGPAGVYRPDLSALPTLTSPAQMTGVGVILGTAAYMAPEQARGKTVDKRADIWAFGCVLFEMLTGTRAFQAEDVSITLAEVMKSEPDWRRLPPLPPLVESFLRQCLRKDPRQRTQAIGDVRLALEGAFETAASSATSTSTASASRGRLPWMVATAAVMGIVAMATPTVRHLRETPAPIPPEIRVEITTPATDAPLQFALSPDGRSLVFVASGDGPSRLWLRQLDQTEARPLVGTEGASDPFWSPDSRTVGFFAAGKLLRLDLAGGAPQALTTVGGGDLSASWNADGTILFSQQSGRLWRVAATGGDPVVVAEPDPPRQAGLFRPEFLPDGRQYLFYAPGTFEAAGIYLGSLDGGAPTRLTAADAAGAFLAPDRVVFVQGGTLVSRRLDHASGALTGDPVTLADRVGVDRTGGGFVVSKTGLVAYRTGGNPPLQLTWRDRSGTPVGVAGERTLGGQHLQVPELSPDGRRVAAMRTLQGNLDLWLLELLRGGMTRLTFDVATDADPVWSPDGTRLAFTSNRTGLFNLYVKASNGSGAEARLVDSVNPVVPQDWSRDGRWLLYFEVHPTTARDLWALDMTTPDLTPHVVANTPAQEVLAQFSPDGRWVAYQTDESGRFEVVVQPFPEAGGKWQVSTGGGVAPRWRADGKELYFLAPDATMMAAPVTVAGASFAAGTPVALFPSRIRGGGSVATDRAPYAVARDGRFLINQPVGGATTTPITLLLNWHPPGNN